MGVILEFVYSKTSPGRSILCDPYTCVQPAYEFPGSGAIPHIFDLQLMDMIHITCVEGYTCHCCNANHLTGLA